MPVINTKKALEQAQEDELMVIVDDVVNRDNVRRFVQSRGHDIKIEDRGENLFYMHITRNPEAASKTEIAASVAGGVVVFITTDKLGEGDDMLGGILMKAFLNTLHDSEPKPDKIIFINNGVRLVVEGSDVLDSLAALSGDGIEIVACGTCLNYYNIIDKLKFGITGNMYDIVNSLLEAGKIIKI
ncbi:MAG: sulfurtransferase-like selenium metabolism protein YedF [Dehalococcoidia bacterium]|nr:sulfurtransferase-like selenium metabolism protein YedF [Dehalococcoidia bacterium]